jgi:chromate transporter
LPTDRHSPIEVLRAFLKLGLISFGGPIAHIGYFRSEFVARRRWPDDATYTDLVALCQFLPGPASSQVGLSIGLLRAGYLGALAAWTGFTMPSACALVLFAYGAPALTGPAGVGLLHGLKLVAVSIVAQAVFGMARTRCTDPQRACIAALAAVLMLYAGASVTQIGAIVLGGVAGLLVCRSTPALMPTPAPAPAPAPAPTSSLTPTSPHASPTAIRLSPRVGLASLAAFTLLLVALPVYCRVGAPRGVELFAAFYRAGALVFGGGHVVLPLLRDAFVTPGWVSDDTFLAGYGAAQAVPGPLFTFAAYLGTVVQPSLHGVTGAALGLVGIFLPGMLILVGTLPFWDTLHTRPGVQAAMRGINAAVVGILGAALYDPVWTSSVHSLRDVAAALIGFALLTLWHVRPLLVVIFAALAGIALQSR